MHFFITLQVHNTVVFCGRYDGVGNSKFIASSPELKKGFFRCVSLKFLLSNMNLPLSKTKMNIEHDGVELFIFGPCEF